MNAIAEALQHALQREVPNVEQPLPWKLVTHQHPDTDALVCLWAASRFIVGKDEGVSYHFVRSGESLDQEETEGFRVLHMDTGFSDLDQHGQTFSRTSSFELMCKKYGWLENEALRPLLELTVATDNVEKVSPTSIHYVFKGLEYYFWDKEKRESDMCEVVMAAFMMLDTLYGQWEQNVKNRKAYLQHAKCSMLKGGVNLALIFNRPKTREAAFDDGADVVIWTDKPDWKRKSEFYVGIQVNRESPVTLEHVMSDIRTAEARKRGVSLKNKDLLAPGKDPDLGGWYLHGSLKLIVCGSRSHQLEEGEFTALSQDEIASIVRNRLWNVRIDRSRR